MHILLTGASATSLSDSPPACRDYRRIDEGSLLEREEELLDVGNNRRVGLIDHERAPCRQDTLQIWQRLQASDERRAETTQ